LNQAVTIKLFLVHGSPNGLRTAELSNWSGKAIAAPRTEIVSLLKREELGKTGFYILSGVSSETGEKAIYIGETENVASRLKNHANKDFWNTVIVFVSKDDNLTKAHARYLEGRLINLANEIGTSIVMNTTNSGAKLPESDASEMNVFLEKCLQLLPVLGLSDFNRALEEKDIKKENILYCKIKGLVASGKRSSNGFVVFSGSQAVLKHRESGKEIKTKREELLSKGLLKVKDSYLVFTKDIEFGSPSMAGGIVSGGSTNGLTNWKNSNDVSLKEIEKEQT